MFFAPDSLGTLQEPDFCGFFAEVRIVFIPVTPSSRRTTQNRDYPRSLI
jgi:hypothetical protein